MKYRYIVVEGPIGCGKSTLARKVAERYGADLLLEDAIANPFLSRFYQDMKRHALATQMFFLFQRANQLSVMRQPDLFDRKTVADYMLAKDRIFARLTLDDNEYALYAQLHDHLKPQAPVPDLASLSLLAMTKVCSLDGAQRNPGIDAISGLSTPHFAIASCGLRGPGYILD